MKKSKGKWCRNVLAKFLTLAIIVTSIGVLPAVKASAATYTYNMSFDSDGFKYDNTDYMYTAEVEVGQKYEFGEAIYFYYYDENNKYVRKSSAGVSGLSWESSDTAIATVSSKGSITFKKKGNVSITAKYEKEKGEGYTSYSTKTLKFTVVAAGKNTSKVDLKKIKAAVTNVNKAYGGKVTISNAYKLKEAILDAEGLNENITKSSYVNMNGFLYKKVTSEYGYSYYQSSGKMVLPEAAAYKKCVNEYNAYVSKISNPESAASVSATGGKNSIAITLKKAVTAEQILKIKENNLWDARNKNVAEQVVYVKDKKTGHLYYADAKFTKGSKKVSITIKNLKLVKGRKYSLVEGKYSDSSPHWSTNKTFTAK